jgi:hypothetical protein
MAERHGVPEEDSDLTVGAAAVRSAFMADEIEINWEPNRTLVTSLAQAGTKFIIVGSTALRFYVPEKPEPNDLDILIEPTLVALDSFDAAAAPLGFGGVRATAAHLSKPNTGFPAKTPHGLNVDVFVTAEGFDFPEHWAAAQEAVMVSSSTVVRVAAQATLDAWLRRALVMEPTREAAIRADLELLTNVRSST